VIGRGVIKWYCEGEKRKDSRGKGEKVFFLEISPDAANGAGVIEIYDPNGQSKNISKVCMDYTTYL
jgi:hypothetical protein